MNAGYLRHHCWIKQPMHTSDGMGGMVTTWGTVCVCWGAMDPSLSSMRGREWVESALKNAEISAIFRMRYYAGITPAMQLYFGSRTFEIVSVIDPSERHRELQLLLKELVIV